MVKLERTIAEDHRPPPPLDESALKVWFGGGRGAGRFAANASAGYEGRGGRCGTRGRKKQLCQGQKQHPPGLFRKWESGERGLVMNGVQGRDSVGGGKARIANLTARRA